MLGDVTARASRTLARCLSHGTPAIRSHVNVDKDAGFAGIEALAQLRGDWADRVRLQLVGFMTPHPGQDLDWLRANIDRAAGLSDAMGRNPARSDQGHGLRCPGGEREAKEKILRKGRAAPSIMGACGLV